MTYTLLFFTGMAASLHCVGMCGVFPLSLAAGRHRCWQRQLLYNAGRLNTLVCIGALSGALGAALVATASIRALERGLAVAAGAVMILIALEMLGFRTRVTSVAAAITQASVRRLLGGVIRSRSWAAPLALGVFNAFLPCQLIYAFAARAASTASVYEGSMTMLAFGLGTVPAMFAVGIIPALARPGVHARLSRAAAVVVLLFGAATVLRGLDWLPHFGRVTHTH